MTQTQDIHQCYFHAQAVIEAWRADDNEHWPHGSLGDLTPAEYATIHQETSPSPEA